MYSIQEFRSQMYSRRRVILLHINKLCREANSDQICTLGTQSGQLCIYLQDRRSLRPQKLKLCFSIVTTPRNEVLAQEVFDKRKRFSTIKDTSLFIIWFPSMSANQGQCLKSLDPSSFTWASLLDLQTLWGDSPNDSIWHQNPLQFHHQYNLSVSSAPWDQSHFQTHRCYHNLHR